MSRRGAKSFELHSMFGEIPVNEDGEGVVEATIPASEIEFYAARLLTLGAELQVESPPELVEAIARRAREVTELYAG